MTAEDQIHPIPDQFNLDPGEHRKSMAKLLNYHFEKFIAGHGHPVYSEAPIKLSTSIPINQHLF